MNQHKTFHSVCCYLYVISKYGYPPPAKDTPQHLEEMKKLGFRSIELEGIHETHLKDFNRHRQEIRSAVDRLDVHIPVFCVVLPGLSSADRSVRSHNLDLFELGCEIAAFLDAGGVLDNAPLPPYEFPAGMPVTRHYDEEVLLSARLPAGLYWEKYWSELIQTYRDACDIAARYGLKYHVHPYLGGLVANTDAFLFFHQAVDRENLRFNLDTANQFFLKDNLILALKRLAKHMDYIHISDNRGKRVEHLVPGDGDIEWDAFFATLHEIGFTGSLGLDVGGAETGIDRIEDAYIAAAGWLEENWYQKEWKA